MPGQKDNRESEKEVLDLIGSKPKRPRKKQQVEPAAAGETPVPATDAARS